MYNTPRHGGIQKHMRKTQQATSESRVSHDTTIFPGTVTADLASEESRFTFPTKLRSFFQVPWDDSALVPFVETGSAPIIRPANTNNQQSAFNKKSIPPLVSLGSGLDPFSTMFQSRNTRVSIEKLKHECMYKSD